SFPYPRCCFYILSFFHLGESPLYLVRIRFYQINPNHSSMNKLILVLFFFSGFALHAEAQTSQWGKLELSFTSEKAYDNPLYELKEFYAVFTSPTGQSKKIYGFWDGGKDFKIRFSPDEIGSWTYRTHSSDKGLD